MRKKLKAVSETTLKAVLAGKNLNASAMGQLSAKARFKGKSKKEVSQMMKDLRAKQSQKKDLSTPET